MESDAENKQESEIKLDRKSKVLFMILGIIIIGSVAATYWRYMVKRDYIVEAQIDCDPETENCFIWQCDPMSLEEGEECTGVPDNDTWYYKIFRRNAKNIPDCDPNDENCTAYVCDGGETDCSEELCTPENVPDGEQCNDPEQYLLENSPEEENVECAEGDEECLAEQEESVGECAPDDEECLAQPDIVECEEGDEECAAGEEEPAEAEEQGILNGDNSGKTNSDDQYIPPLVVEPN